MFLEAKQAFRQSVPIIFNAPAKPSHNRSIENARWTLSPCVSKLRSSLKMTGINTKVIPTTKRPRRTQTAKVAPIREKSPHDHAWRSLRRVRCQSPHRFLVRRHRRDQMNRPRGRPNQAWSPRFEVMYHVENNPKMNVTRSLPYVEHAFNAVGWTPFFHSFHTPS